MKLEANISGFEILLRSRRVAPAGLTCAAFAVCLAGCDSSTWTGAASRLPWLDQGAIRFLESFFSCLTLSPGTIRALR